MDSLIIDRQRDADINSRAIGASFVEENSSMDHLVNAVESSKTDEAKLNEILTLLHRITRTLSSFEQSPLLAEELKKDFGKEVKLDIDNFLKNCIAPENPKNIQKENDDKLVSKEEGKAQPHRFAKETSSLRSEIEDAIRRKNVLDERLGAFIAQKEQKRLEEELKESQVNKDTLEEVDAAGEYPQIKITPVNDDDEKSKCKDMRQESSLHSMSLINEEVINDLRNDEIEIPWLAESGLSSEISSLSVTINTIVEENKQWYAIYNDLAEPIMSRTEKETKGAKPKKKKMERKNSRLNSEDFLFLEQIQDEKCMNNGDPNLNPTSPLTTPFMKSEFERKIKELIKEQTDMIAQLQKEKKRFNEKSQSLEKVVAELIKVNRENRMKYVEEFQAVDVENCRLEDDLLSLKRQNQKLLKDLQRLKSLQGLESNDRALQNDECSARTCSGSDHNICLEYFRLLLMGKDTKVEMPKRFDKTSSRPEEIVNGLYNHMSASESNLNLIEASSTKSNRFSSLPAIVTLNPEVGQSKTVLNTSMESDSNNHSELSVLKTRIDDLESYFHQQNSNGRCSKTSDAFVSNGNDELYLEREASGDLRSPSSDGNVEESQEKDVSKYKRRVSLLLTEKEEMSLRIEELMGMMRELSILFRSTKEELIATKRERNFLLENFKNRCDNELDETKMGGGESPLKVRELNQSLQEKCSELELEVEKAWNEANNYALERDKMAAEKEKLNHFLTTSLAEIEEENSKLKSRLRKFEESNFSKMNENSLKKLFEEKKEQYGPLSLSALNFEKTEANVNASDETSKQEEINANWQQSLIWLQRCFVEEKLHSQLLEAAERENSARVALLSQRVKDRGEKYNELLVKYKKLHLMLLSKKAEKKANKRIMKEWSYKMEEYNSTTTAIEDNYKIMLSSLGNNIGIAVEILASHLFLSPSHIHPSPELFADPAFWFAAQCSRLRWLQAQLRKLCLRSWKNNDVETSEVNIRHRMKPSVSDLFRGHSLDTENRNIPHSNNVFGTSLSTPSSPSKVAPTVSNDHLQSISSESNSEGCNILTSLNDAEINVTSQQVKLMQSKNLQFNNLVGILQQTGGVNCSSVSSSLVSDLTSFRNQESFGSDGHSVDSSLVGNLDKDDNP